MKKLLLLCVFLSTMTSTVAIAQPLSVTQGAKEVFLSKPAMMVYGMVLGAGGLHLILQSQYYKTQNTIKRGQVVSEVISKYSDPVQYCKEMVTHPDIGYSYDPKTQYHYFRIKSELMVNTEAIENLKKLAECLDAYKAYQEAKALPSFGFSKSGEFLADGSIYLRTITIFGKKN
jgi:hypothetical protein